MIAHPWFAPPILNEFSDGFNINHSRNITNTDKLAYNCGGYALGTYSWYNPVPEEYYNIDYEIDSIEFTNYLYDCVDALLYDFTHRHIRVCDFHTTLNDNEYLFAFRVSTDGDFHFIKRGRNNVWYHKRGQLSIIERMTVEELFSASWCNRYDSPTIFFAIEY